MSARIPALRAFPTRGIAGSLLPTALALAFQGGFAVAVMALDRANRALPSNIAYVAAVECGFAALFLVVAASRIVLRRMRVEALRGAALDAELPEAGPGAERAWRDLACAMRASARAALAERDAKARDELDSFLASVHALKTPATTLSLMAQRAARDGLPLDPREILAEVDELDRLLDRTVGRLRLDDFESGSRILHVGAAEAVRASVRKHRRLLLARGLRAEIRGDDFVVATDPSWLGFILDQLVSNAGKYAATTLAIRFATDGGRGYIELSDDGPGLDPEDMERAFGKSATGSAGARGGAQDGAPASSGYGLYLARQASLRLGISLELASAGGTLARLAIPLAFDPRGSKGGKLTPS